MYIYIYSSDQVSAMYPPPPPITGGGGGGRRKEKKRKEEEKNTKEITLGKEKKKN